MSEFEKGIRDGVVIGIGIGCLFLIAHWSKAICDRLDEIITLLEGLK